MELPEVLADVGENRFLYSKEASPSDNWTTAGKVPSSLYPPQVVRATVAEHFDVT